MTVPQQTEQHVSLFTFSPFTPNSIRKYGTNELGNQDLGESNIYFLITGQVHIKGTDGQSDGWQS